MISLIKDGWNWLTTQALHQLLALFLACLIAFAVLLKYPVQFERTTYEHRQNIEVTKTSTYMLNSTISKEKGAKLKLCTQNYYIEVKNEIPQN